ncbi:MAG: Rha family transcriptional regulator [Oscillospiraceae bacterium]|jgi:phage regulator Rha-like protein|nr:Rha family transcriptional regulator [Oscillospiraceae bacterium]
MNELMKTQSIHTIDSREIADMVGKEHKNLLADIRGYITHLTGLDFSPLEFFVETTYDDSTGRTEMTAFFVSFLRLSPQIVPKR